MNGKTMVALLLAISAILAGAPGSFARPQYLTNLSAVYGDGSCTTCHVMSQSGGPRGSNGNFGSHTPDGTYEPRNFNRTNESRSYNRTFESRYSNRTLPRNSYGTLFENQPGHVTDPGAALIAIGPPPAATPADTTVASRGIPTAPGFGIVASMAGLFALVLLFRRRNK
ncbi:MAG TPA: PGF-CTERM sorting domain-containing protein [Candidatus Methanoperedens sp.]